jgi:peptide deformylase
VSIRLIHLLGSSPLRERAAEVGTVDDEVRQLVRDLFDTMYAAKGVGLAANQIGVTRRVAVVHAGEQDEPLVLIDPVIVEGEDEATDEEGCLSIPEIYADVTRPAKVVVETTTLEGDRVRVPASELKARAIQHEIDHLDGILFLDKLSPLKRRLLLRKWKAMRKGETSLLREVPETATPTQS